MPVVSIAAEFPDKLQFLFDPARYKVAYGGRGGAKSWGFARALLILALQRRMRILCARELQVSIADSVHKLLGEQITDMGLRAYYTVQQTSITAANGSEFIFAGLHTNVNKIKSMEGVDIVWVEEAQCVSNDSWETLIPTVRKDGSEIWVSFNPDLDSDPTYQRFVVNAPESAKVVKIGWEDNPWFPTVLAEEKDYLYAKDPETAAHVWGGGTRKNSVAAVLRGRYVVESFEPEAGWNGPYFGADWGFGVDPTTLIKLWIDGRVLYVEYEAYGVGVDLDDTPALFDAVPKAKEYIIRADCARPETISHMRRHGYPKMIGCTKGSGSVEDGVEHLRSYERIVIHTRCKHAAEEARLWSYKQDKLSGDVLPVLKDGNDNCWDAARYALEPIIRAGKPKPKKPIPEERTSDYDRKPREDGESWRTV